MKKTKIIFLLAAALITVMTGCGAPGTAQTKEPDGQTVKIEAEGQESIRVPGDNDTPVDGAASETEPSATNMAPGAENNDHNITLYTLSGDFVADIVVPDFLTRTDHAASYVLADNGGDYEASYMYYGAWDAEKFFSENVNKTAYNDNENFSAPIESELQTAEVSGRTARWKKITSVYEGDTNLQHYGAEIDMEGGVLGVVFYAYDMPNADDMFLEVLDGITNIQ